MTNAKSAVRAALLELIEADAKATEAPWKDIDFANCIVSGDWDRVLGRIGTSPDTDVESPSNRKLICLARNLAPGMARILLKMLDEPDCNECGGEGFIPAGPDPHWMIPCPRCAARWQEWSEILGVKEKS